MNLSLQQNNVTVPTGMHEENYALYLAVVGALCIFVLLSLIVTPSIYHVLVSRIRHEPVEFTSGF